MKLRLALALGAALSSAQAPTLRDTTAYTTTAVPLRTSPDARAPLAARLAARTRVRVASCAKGWCEVGANGLTGYVRRAVLSTVEPPPPPRRRVEPRRDGALTSTERDSIVRDVQGRRATWRARGITEYRLRVAQGCFCPWPQTPMILAVKGGVAVALYDTTGRAAGPPREPWSLYSVDSLFAMVEELARRVDVLAVTYDSGFGYPATIRGDTRLGYPDDWFWVRAGPLAVAR